MEGDIEKVQDQTANNSTNPSSSSNQSNSNRELDSEADFNALLMSKLNEEIEEESVFHDYEKDIAKIRNSLDEYANQKLSFSLPRRTIEICDFWKSRDAAIFQVAEIIFTVPCTQVSVERMFSHLKIILSDQRMRLSQGNIDNIMTLRCNKKLS